MDNTNSVSPSEPDRSLSKPYYMVVGLFLATINVGLVVTSFGIFFKPVSADFGWTRAETSGAFSLSTIISGVAGIIAGKLGDRISLRLIIVICGIIDGIAYLLLSQMTSLWQLYLYYGILVGAGMANIVPVGTLVTRWFKRQRGRMTSIALSGAAFSSVFSPYLAGWLIDFYNWHVSYVVIGSLCLVITVISGFLIFNSGKQKTHPDEEIPRLENLNKNEGISFRKVLGSWAFWCLALIYFCFHFSLSVVQVHIVPHATDLGVSAVLAASILTISNGTNVVGSFILGSINDKIGGKKSLMLGLAALGIGVVLLLIANQFWLLCVFAVVFGLGWGGTGALRSVIVAELFGLRSHGPLVGAVLLIALVGGTLSPILAGYIFDVTGQYQMAFLLLLGVSAIGFILSVLLSRQKIRFK